MLVQALIPGLVTVAGKLQWGRGGDWQDGEEFFGELLSTTWVVLQEWSGQDRPYAVLDLLSAIRCRLRRQLFRSKDDVTRSIPVGSEPGASGPAVARPETDLEELARILIELDGEGMRRDEVQVLYAHHVLGYSMAELASMTGRDRRSLYTRRDRGQRRLCA
jgi:DNA-directed RNA polymerase specialized sigma24 family protein